MIGWGIQFVIPMNLDIVDQPEDQQEEEHQDRSCCPAAHGIGLLRRSGLLRKHRKGQSP